VFPSAGGPRATTVPGLELPVKPSDLAEQATMWVDLENSGRRSPALRWRRYPPWGRHQGRASVGGTTPLPEQAQRIGAPLHWTSTVQVRNVDEAVAEAKQWECARKREK